MYVRVHVQYVESVLFINTMVPAVVLLGPRRQQEALASSLLCYRALLSGGSAVLPPNHTPIAIGKTASQ